MFAVRGGKSLYSLASVPLRPTVLGLRGLATEAGLKYNAPKLGVNPAYDEAIKVLEAHKTETVEKVKAVEAQIEKAKKESPEDTESLESLAKQKYDLEVESLRYDPETLWNFKHGQIDMKVPVYRHLKRIQFKKGPLSTLMERITQMNVIPDLLETSTKPSVNMEIKYTETGVFEPGLVLESKKVYEKPEITVTNFHEDTKLYTLLMVDPDDPNQEFATYQEKCHWLMTNIPLNMVDNVVSKGDTVLEYLPPHPAKGTKKHRFTFMLLEQPENGSAKVDIQTPESRIIDSREIRKAFGLEPRGVSFFRAEWDASVSKVYKELGIDEPVYGKTPRENPYMLPDGRQSGKFDYM
ncbi:PEBP-like protein [Basidiobolus meristosporus CBS 931.73]|uniref:PEBP-like protein n=1 Tax=Basidiobolus meristosporus CBS 931.73 TaxID=1314790 RepID=A0A1Y1YRY1_9FUNG|nr:PEBP-like protein [Basidiobolus meristosporus CBS 931.73]|eukprot:ORY00574.1 PEBP-like protein [Basidiobolus meristosporus CBS 931.73]